MKATAELLLVDDAGSARDAFAPGDSLFATGRGLQPCAAYEFTLESERGGSLLARYCSDRHGWLPPSLLIAYCGMLDDELEPGRPAHVAVQGPGQRWLLPLLLVDRDEPFLFSSDREGRLQTGVVEGDELGVTLRNFPPGCVRVILVPRQFGWRVGDSVEPARDQRGRPLVATARLTGEERHVAVA